MLPSSSSADNVPLRNAGGEAPESPRTGQLIYAVVARERTILAECALCVGNFATVTRILLAKITPSTNGQRKSYTYDNYVFHYITSGGLAYVCLADRALGQTVPLNFLDQVCGQFESAYATASKTAVALQMNGEFQPTLRSLMAKVNESADKSMDKIRSHLAEISDNMVDNIDKIMQRQEKIELLVEKTESLNQTALQFRRQAVDVRRILWWRDIRAKITMVTIGLVLIFLIVMWLCGGTDFHKCQSN